jgi:amidase
MAEAGAGYTATDYLLALDYLRTLARDIVAFWDGHDILVTPTLAQPPVPVGGLDPDPGAPAMQMLEKAAAWVPFTPVVNVTGQPAISLPLHHSADGLPIGVQLIGPPAGEELLLSLSGQLEQARPWLERRPELAVT